MRRILPGVALLLFLSLRVDVPPAWACSCAALTPDDWVAEEGSAWIGEIVAVDVAAGCGGVEGYRTATAEVVEVLAGDLEVGSLHLVTVWVGAAGGGGGADCSVAFDMAIGDEWLFYGESPEVNLCYGGGPVEERQAEIAALRESPA